MSSVSTEDLRNTMIVEINTTPTRVINIIDNFYSIVTTLIPEQLTRLLSILLQLGNTLIIIRSTHLIDLKWTCAE